MAKFYGVVGFSLGTVETTPGIWKDAIREIAYYGDVMKNIRKLENGQDINDDINVSNVISIVADPYAHEHFFQIRYVHWMGANWKVVNVEVQMPRLVLSVGGVYNGPTAGLP